MAKTCLDLFAGLGGFSAAFADADGWEVVTVDIEARFDPNIQADVMDLRPADLPDADVVLASPPCNCWTIANGGYHIQEEELVTDIAKEMLTLVHHTIGLCKSLQPDYWFMENPRGHLRKFIGRPTGTITYCQYGQDYWKATDLWGDHPNGFSYKSCPIDANCHHKRIGEEGSGAPTTAAERAKVPYELSQAILEAVEGRADQQPLTGFGV